MIGQHEVLVGKTRIYTKEFSVPRFACFALRGFESGSLATSIIWPRFYSMIQYLTRGQTTGKLQGRNEGTPMQEAKLNGRLVQADPDSPEIAECPACGGEVCKRRRKVGRHGHTYFYRHKAGVGDDCPLRYKPTG
jgi:hypothetical protein